MLRQIRAFLAADAGPMRVTWTICLRSRVAGAEAGHATAAPWLPTPQAVPGRR